MKFLGKKMVGYRYGKAPASGYSWNTMENKREPGVSMAKIGHMKELRSIAVINLKSKKVKKYYYLGTIGGEGGDANEICLKNLKSISYSEYVNYLKSPEIIQTSNEVVDYFADNKIWLINRGYNIGEKGKEGVEEWRKNNKFHLKNKAKLKAKSRKQSLTILKSKLK